MLQVTCSYTRMRQNSALTDLTISHLIIFETQDGQIDKCAVVSWLGGSSFFRSPWFKLQEIFTSFPLMSEMLCTMTFLSLAIQHCALFYISQTAYSVHTLHKVDLCTHLQMLSISHWLHHTSLNVSGISLLHMPSFALFLIFYSTLAINGKLYFHFFKNPENKLSVSVKNEMQQNLRYLTPDLLDNTQLSPPPGTQRNATFI